MCVGGAHLIATPKFRPPHLNTERAPCIGPATVPQTHPTTEKVMRNCIHKSSLYVTHLPTSKHWNQHYLNQHCHNTFKATFQRSRGCIARNGPRRCGSSQGAAPLRGTSFGMSVSAWAGIVPEAPPRDNVDAHASTLVLAYTTWSFLACASGKLPPTQIRDMLNKVLLKF